MVQQDIALLQGGEHVGGLRRFDLREMGMGRGKEGRVLEFCSIHVGQGEQAAQVERPGQMEDLPGS